MEDLPELVARHDVTIRYGYGYDEDLERDVILFTAWIPEQGISVRRNR